MFVELYVENLALIEKAVLTWSSGLNVLSGETGAGKSMVIGAVSLLLGGRGSKDYIRKGAETCFIQGTFSAPFEDGILAALEEAGLPLEDELIFSRELNINSKSTCRINMRQVPLTVFKELSRRLINIHGQMEHMSLLEADNQRQLLDSFGDNSHKDVLKATAAKFNIWQSALKELRKAQRNVSNFDERRDLLMFQLQEIEDAELKIGEAEDLLAERKLLQSAEDLIKHARKASAEMDECQFPPLGAIAAGRDEIMALSGLDETVEPLAERINNAYYELEDIIYEIRLYQDKIVNDPMRLEQVEERLHKIRSLTKKYGGDEESVLAVAESHRLELEQWDNREEQLEMCQKAEASAKADFLASAEVLTKKRISTGKRLAAAITEELHYLRMSEAVFGVDVLRTEPQLSGIDEVVFMISPNPGEGMKPVAKIASGGEMSRIMLSIKVILAKLDAIPTLIFDEIDTGLGGRALMSVAEKLSQISCDTQAICVTHAPVIAAFADHNLLVAKGREGERTITKVAVLSEHEKLQEICRMLAGENITEATVAQAKELIALGQK
ncbi:MAG: DNA repair protein RecN [Bacillota bacterium]|jgi:DNA repair protein RecN (Recombination protein N)